MAKEHRRTKARKISLSPHEDELIIEQAKKANSTPAEWIRAAALNKKSVSRNVIPHLNQEMFLSISKLAETLSIRMWHYKTDNHLRIYSELKSLRAEIGELQKLLMGDYKK